MNIDLAGFEIEAEIGRGGFGVVYRARQLAFDRPAAVKVLLPGTSDNEVARAFARECRAVGALPAHPNIVTVHSTGTTADGRPYLAMEYLGGGSLAGRPPMSADAVTALGIRLADALAVAHAGGVIHRDVKPANILFADEGSTEPVLVDFGISALVGDGSTTSTDLALSVAYASPEILRGERVMSTADVYALGATLFSALTGRTPFANPDGLTPVATLATRILTQPIDDLRTIGVPAALFGVIERCMAKDAAQRYADMAQVRAALERAGAGVAPSRWRLALARRGRRPMMAAAAAAVVLAGAVTAVAITSGDDPRAAPIAERMAGRSATGDGTGATSGAGSTTPVRDLGTGDRAGPPPTPGPGAGSGSGSGATRAGAVPPAVAPGPRNVAGGTAPRRSGGVTSAPQLTAPAPAHSPVLGAVPTLTAKESVAVHTQLRAADSDGGRLSFRVTGLPAGVTASATGLISGTISPDAAKGTTTYRSIVARKFRLGVTVTDPTGRSDTATAVWTVRDTRFRMPSYRGYRGCNGDGGCSEPVRNFRQLGPHSLRCREAPKLVGRVVAQSAAAGSYQAYGRSFVFYVGAKSC